MVWLQHTFHLNTIATYIYHPISFTYRTNLRYAYIVYIYFSKLQRMPMFNQYSNVKQELFVLNDIFIFVTRNLATYRSIKQDQITGTRPCIWIMFMATALCHRPYNNNCNKVGTEHLMINDWIIFFLPNITFKSCFKSRFSRDIQYIN